MTFCYVHLLVGRENHHHQEHHHHHHHGDHLYVKVHPLLVRLDDVAPVEEVVIVHHPAGEVGLAQHLIYELAGFWRHKFNSGINFRAGFCWRPKTFLGGFPPTCFCQVGLVQPM